MLALVPLLGLGLGACASGGKHPSAEGQPASVTFTDYRSGLRFTIVNETHTDRVELYSRSVKASQANTKVATDEVLDALFERMGKLGFFRDASSGSAPSGGSANSIQALEVESREGAYHMVQGRGATDGGAKVFRDVRAAVLEVHANIFQAQSIDLLPEDGPLFEGPRPGSGSRL